MKREIKIKICTHTLNMLFEKNDTRHVKSIFGIHTFTSNDKDMDSCKIIGNRIVWRVEKSDFIKGHGRWRTDKDDEKILFSIDGDFVNIKINDNIQTFKLK